MDEELLAKLAVPVQDEQQAPASLGPVSTRCHPAAAHGHGGAGYTGRSRSRPAAPTDAFAACGDDTCEARLATRSRRLS